MAQLEHIEAIERRLWGAADTLRANSNHASNEYFLPVMGLIFLRHAYSRLAMLFTGATIKHLPREKLARVEIEIPPTRLTSLFLEQVGPIKEQIDVLQTGIKLASHARDLLLPRLMNGEVPV